MSHEIRTPLNAIIGFSGLMNQDIPEEEKEEYMSIINSNNTLLLHLIGDILDLSKLESGTIEIINENFDTDEFFNEIYSTFRTRCMDSSHNLIARNKLSKSIISLDRNRIAQVFGNFISNAIKYSESGDIIISQEYINGGLEISVTDNGIGIDKDLQHRIFGRFEKLDTFAQGTGLGLAISKAITENMNGKIGFESDKGKGSTFWAWFPCDIKYTETLLAFNNIMKNNVVTDI